MSSLPQPCYSAKFATKHESLPSLPSVKDPYSELTDAERLALSQRRAIVDAWLEVRAQFRSLDQPLEVATAAFLAGHPGLSRGTLYRWSNLKASGDPLALLDRRRGNGRHAAEASAAAIGDQAWSRFRELWLDLRSPTIRSIWLIVNHESQQHPGDPAWSWPATGAVRRKIKNDLPPIVSDFARLGEREWDRRFGPRMKRDYTQYRSNQVWVGDVHPFDAFCRTSQADWTVVRPKLSAFLDLRSRLIAGWHVTLHENQDAVLLAFRSGVEQFGPPAEAVVDNGKPYRATGVSGGRPSSRGRIIEDEDYVRSVFGGLNVAVHFAIPYNPDSKPVERWFRTLEDQFCRTIVGYCGSRKDDLFKAADKLAHEHPERLLTVAELTAAFEQYLVAYHATPHTGDGMDGLSPRAAFDAFDPIPRAIVPDGAMDYLLMRVHSGPRNKDTGKREGVTVTKFGVRYNGIDYGVDDPRLFDLQGQKVTLRVHPEDASYVIVCDLEDRPICRARNDSLTLTGAKQEHVAAGMKARRGALKRMRTRVYGEDARLIMQSTTDATIDARLRAARGADETMRKLMAATGTDGGGCPPSRPRKAGAGTVPIAPRNLRPMRSDLAESISVYNRQVDPPPATAAVRTFDELADALDESEPAAPALKVRSLEEAFGD